MKKPGVFSAMVLLAALVGCGEVATEQSVEPAVEPAAGVESVDAAGLEQFITAQMEELHIPGVAVAIVDRERVVLSAGYGWVDVENQIPMTPDTVTNIASISKTFTNAAVMQLVEKGRLGLDDDVGQHLPFPVRHPAHPEVPITVRQLLTHTSGIEDGDAYDESYACGDPAVSLADWIRGYLEPGGEYYSAAQNFLPTAPEEAYSYSNVGFGLAGYLVEVVSGLPFAEYVRLNLFEPLGMTESGFYLTEFDSERHSEPYAWIDAGDTLENVLFGTRNGEKISEAGELWGHNGADPGIRSYMQFNAKTGRGVIVFANRATRFTPIAERLWAEVAVAGGNS